MKRFHSIRYAALLTCMVLAGLACSSASNTARDTKPEANASAPAGEGGGGGAASTSMPAASPAASPAAESTPPTIDEIDIYLVAVGDKGEKGLKIGCDDSLIRVTRKIKPTVAPLRAALEELLATPREYSKELGNYWWGKDLKLKSVAINEGVATIHISGEGPFVGGICDVPRITEQIENTAMQFSSVNTVKVFVNDKPLADALR